MSFARTSAARGFQCFFFQAEDGIRHYKVTGVQTCALPISYRIAYSMFIALRVIPLIEDQMKTVQAAQMVRGVGVAPGIRGRIRNGVRYTLPVLVGVMRECNVMVLSMESRAFGAYPTRTFVHDVHMGKRGIAVTIALIALVITWYVLIGLGIV